MQHSNEKKQAMQVALEAAGNNEELQEMQVAREAAGNNEKQKEMHACNTRNRHSGRTRGNSQQR